MLIALAFDGLLVLLGRVLLPWARLARPNDRAVVIKQEPVVTDVQHTSSALPGKRSIT